MNIFIFKAMNRDTQTQTNIDHGVEPNAKRRRD